LVISGSTDVLFIKSVLKTLPALIGETFRGFSCVIEKLANIWDRLLEEPALHFELLSVLSAHLSSFYGNFKDGEESAWLFRHFSMFLVEAVENMEFGNPEYLVFILTLIPS
jgi:hypothetical protein